MPMTVLNFSSSFLILHIKLERAESDDVYEYIWLKKELGDRSTMLWHRSLTSWLVVSEAQQDRGSKPIFSYGSVTARVAVLIS